MFERPTIRTQFLIFTLFGDHVLPHGGWIWTGSLLRMLELLGVTERAARSTLSRMSRKGWLKANRVGRHSQYRLTPRGALLVQEAGERIFEPRQTEWDGKWHIVVYTVPEKKRDLRNRLRQRLTFLGFGRLAPATWISPQSRQREVEALLDDLGARGYAQYFSGMRLGFGTVREIVGQCWDLETLNADYLKFIEKHQPSFEKCLAQGRQERDPADCFVLRFWVTQEYASFPRRDPNLPVVLLPPDWQGGRAAELLRQYRELLHEPAEAFVGEMLNATPG